MDTVRPALRNQDDLSSLFHGLDTLTEFQRHSLAERYRFLIREYRRRSMYYTFLFYTLRVTVTAGSLAVPALLSIQQTNMSKYSDALYWFTWGTALAVTASNGIITLFKLDKRFFTLHATMERLRSETWQFIQLSGRYSGHNLSGNHDTKPSHANQYVPYCTQLEKINMKRVEEEFMKNTEVDSGGDVGSRPPAAIARSRRGAGGMGAPFASNSSILVPSPASSLITPFIPNDTEDSYSSLEEVSVNADDSKAATHSKKATTESAAKVPVSNGSLPVHGNSDTRIVVLSTPQDVPGVTTVGRRAGV